MRSVISFVMGALLGAVFAGAAYHFDLAGIRSWVVSVTRPARQSQVLPRRSSFTALGTIEPEQGVVNVSSPLIGQRIITVNAVDSVKAGQSLIMIDDKAIQTELKVAEAQLSEAAKQRDLNVDLAVAEIDSADLALQQLEARAKVEEQSQQQQIDTLHAKVSQAERDHNRLVELRKQSENLASQQDVERAALAIRAAKTELNDARVAHFRIQQELVSQTDAASKKKQMAALRKRAATDDTTLEALQQQMALANLKLKQTTVAAPIDGTVIKTYGRVGQLVGQGPLLQMADLRRLVCVVEVDTADIQHVVVSDEPSVKVTCRAWGDKAATGKVVSIGSVVGDPVVQPLNPLAPVKREVIEVVIHFTLPQSVQGSRRALVGLPVRAEFEVNQSETDGPPGPQE